MTALGSGPHGRERNRQMASLLAQVARLQSLDYTSKNARAFATENKSASWILIKSFNIIGRCYNFS